jgi:hypothetical protein
VVRFIASSFHGETPLYLVTQPQWCLIIVHPSLKAPGARCERFLCARVRADKVPRYACLFASLLSDLVEYHDAYVFRFLCGGSEIFIFNVSGVLLAGVRQLVSSKEGGKWAHVSKSFHLPPFQKTKYF